VEGPLAMIHRIRLQRDLDLLGDIPEFIMRKAEERLLEEPWTYWRYPLGAATRREPRLYERAATGDPPPVADPSLQIKGPPPAGSVTGPPRNSHETG
jgi:hypothetical protein